MPFGLTNAPATFSRLMAIVLSVLSPFTACFLDDILISTATNFNDHLTHLSIVFDRFRYYNLRLKPSKCYFCKKELIYLGHRIKRDGLKADPAKIQKI